MVLATDSYASAALLEYHCARAGGGVRPGNLARAPGRHRHRLALPAPARTCSSCGASRRLAQDYQPYFRRIEVKRIPLGGGSYHAILGRGFNYAAYRAGVLADIRDRYYRIPPWLPVGRCYFFERYFPR